MGLVSERKAFRRLVRNKTTHHYLKDDGQWTDKLEEATDFPDLQSVVQLCGKYELKDVELVMKFDDEIYDIAVDICHPMGNGR
ncbi:MAG: hypothetical protein JWQ71_2312 [Pedosphaera sp.]|nr:hypothetical protein [Pedosphaera sp.]